nr:hypothetical protein [Oxalobacteraceae bacterium]
MGYREYHSDAAQCRGCEQRSQCTRSANHTKVVTRHVWEDAKEEVNARLRQAGLVGANTPLGWFEYELPDAPCPAVRGA